MMRGYNFSENVRRVLAEAREVASRQRQEFVAPDHMFIALSHAENCSAVGILKAMGIDAGTFSDKFEAALTVGLASRPTGPELPYTTRAKKVLELAMAEAYGLNHSFVGTEHLLLGLIREGKSDAATALVAAGATLERTHEAVGSIVRKEGPATSPRDFEIILAPGARGPRSVTVIIEHRDGRLEAVRFTSLTEFIEHLMKNWASLE